VLNANGIEAQAAPGESGQFDVIRDGELLFSKRAEHRFPDEREILAALR
jgi:predicted Rdx family selenoprotein